MQQQTTQQQDPKIAIENKKVKDLKYKIYIFLMIVVFLFLWGSFGDTMDEVKQLRTQSNQKEFELEDIKALKTQVEENKKTVESILATVVDMTKCINNSQCDKDNKDLVRNFLLLTGNSSPKMDFDQKRILANINDFLLKLDNGNAGGVLNIVTFADTKEINPEFGLYKTSLTLSVDFPVNINFMNFLSKIEKKIDDANMQDRVLYKITSVDYDIANYQSAQTATITMDAYFYK